MLTLIEDAGVRQSLEKIVAGLTSDRTLQDDLMQESLIRLWQKETEMPGRTRSWYLQNCRFHLLRWLSSGRSLDSLKRCKGDHRVRIDDLDDGLPYDGFHTHGRLLAEVCANDIVSTLARELKPCEIAVLRGLTEGMRLHEIAMRLKRAYPTVLRYRRKIARLAIRLGFCPAVREIERARRVSAAGDLLMRANRGASGLPRQATLPRPRTITLIPAIENGLDRGRQDSKGNTTRTRCRTRHQRQTHQFITVSHLSRSRFESQ